jgi:hypothetical protein
MKSRTTGPAVIFPILALAVGLGGVARTSAFTSASPVPPAFAVTGVTASVTPPSYNGGCPATFQFTAKITANGPATVTYKWERSDGASSAPKTVVLTAAGVQVVTSSWTLSQASFSGWERLHVTAPNDVISNQAAFTLACEPFAVTAVSASVSPTTYTGPCPKTFKFTGVISANGPGTVTYRWEHSPGTGAPQTVTFTAAGSKTVTKDYAASMSDYLALIIDKPNTKYNGAALYKLVDFKCTCTSK